MSSRKVDEVEKFSDPPQVCDLTSRDRDIVFVVEARCEMQFAFNKPLFFTAVRWFALRNTQSSKWKSC
jgi:hypothetical protein